MENSSNKINISEAEYQLKCPKLDMLMERYPDKMMMVIDETHADFNSPISMFERIPGEPIIFHVLK